MKTHMSIPPNNLPAALGSFLAQAACETLWPTRCALCDEPGAVLCARCEKTLPYIDYWRACPRCGGPYGSVLCTECNPVMLQTIGRDALPYLSCASAVRFDETTARIATVYKDRGEQRLAAEMARLTAALVAPEWLTETGSRPTVTFVPATRAALKRRGFDHGELLAVRLSECLGLAMRPLLDRPASKDQRALGRKDRARNMAGRFAPLPGSTAPASVLLIDDVCTTGATLAEASDALRTLGCASIRCLTFARVW